MAPFLLTLHTIGPEADAQPQRVLQSDSIDVSAAQWVLLEVSGHMTY